MNKSETNAFLLILGSIVAIITLSHLFDKKAKRSHSYKPEEDGFEADRKSFEKDYENIASDMKKAEKKLMDVI